MKILTEIVALCYISLMCSTQNQINNKIHNSINIDFIRNDKIKYSIVLASCDSCFPIMTKGYRIRTNLTEEQKEIVHSLTFKDWAYLLNDSKSDWAANLTLYEIFDKDAISLYSFNSRKKWIKYFKGEDLAFWEQKLKPSGESQR